MGEATGDAGRLRWKRGLEVAGLALGAAAIVVGFNLAVFAFFLLPPAAAFLWVGAVGALYLWWHARRGGAGGIPGRLAARIRLRAPRVPAGWLGGAVVSTLLVMLGGVTFVEMATGPLDLAESPFHQEILSYMDSTAGWLVFAFAAAVVIPMIEEFAFRGRLQRPLERRWGPAPAVAFAAAVFAVVHVGGPHPLLLAVPFLMGVICGSAVILTGSIWTAVILHGAWNGTIAALAGPAARPAEVADALGPEVAVPASLALVALGTAGWYRLVAARREAGAPSPR